MHHVLGHFSTLAGSNRNSFFERNSFKSFFSSVFSTVLVFFFHTCAYEYSAKDSRRLFCKYLRLSLSAGPSSLLCPP